MRPSPFQPLYGLASSPCPIPWIPILIVFLLCRRNFRIVSGLFDFEILRLTVKQRQMFRNKEIRKFSFWLIGGRKLDHKLCFCEFVFVWHDLDQPYYAFSLFLYHKRLWKCTIVKKNNGRYDRYTDRYTAGMIVLRYFPS